ncbi:nucleoside 2-deoxyribosyltransferase domain-containing protein [Alloalcanivorax xenomutans]|uniref:nucleoside 2-deoxyribosyltransferase domain-containing protein n=1 Tax=Alloalcanivorax xenomutans TaxID=1094342 RepID=UPI003BAD034D
MNPENIVTAIEKFFFEIIGQLLPGFLLLVGLYFVLPEVFVAKFTPSNSLGYWSLVGVSYATGCALTALGSYICIPACLRVVKAPFISWVFSRRIKDMLLSNAQIDEKLQDGAAYKFIKAQFPEEASLRTLRNVAMSSINSSDKETTVRFMFLSLLSQGIATSIFILAFIQAVVWLLVYEWGWDGAGYTAVLFLITLIVTLPFILREREFFDRARRLPIDSYFALLKPTVSVEKSGHPLKTVYLSGGHYSGWQENVIKEANDFKYKDPSKNGLTDPKLYTEWDLEAIRSSDIVFAYFEDSNPGGYGLSLEIGYAAALGKHIILVDEKSLHSTDARRYLKIVQATSNVVFDSLSKGINYLKSLS